MDALHFFAATIKEVGTGENEKYDQAVHDI